MTPCVAADGKLVAFWTTTTCSPTAIEQVVLASQANLMPKRCIPTEDTSMRRAHVSVGTF